MNTSPGPTVAESPPRLSPVLASTRSIHRPVEPLAHECVKLVFVRHGAAILLSEFGEKLVTVGDIVTLGANTLCGSEPEGSITDPTQDHSPRATTAAAVRAVAG